MIFDMSKPKGLRSRSTEAKKLNVFGLTQAGRRILAYAQSLTNFLSWASAIRDH